MLEFLVLFFLLPTVIYVGRFRVPAIPLLWILMSYCLFVLWRTHALHWESPPWRPFFQQLPSILGIFGLFVIVTTVCVHRFAHRDLFSFVRTRPIFWGVVMILYPLLSVYPQGIIYRVFLFDRYRTLFPQPWLLIAMSTIAFAYVHIIFRNWLAVGLTAVGGVLFGLRYAQTGSLFISSFEHALYGCWLFTVGLGRSFFYRGG